MATRSLQTVAFVVLVVLLSATAVEAQTAWMDPWLCYLGPVGGSCVLTARVQGIPDLWGVDFWISYHQNIMHMTDPIVEGVCPAPDLVLANTVDNVAGVGHYAVSAFTSGPCDCTGGGADQVAAVFTFTRVALGVGAIDFSLAAPPGISVLANDSIEVCNETTPACWQNAVTEVPVELMSVSVD